MKKLRKPVFQQKTARSEYKEIDVTGIWTDTFGYNRIDTFFVWEAKMGEFWKEIAAVFAVILLLPLLLAFFIQGRQGISMGGKEEVETYLPFLMAETLRTDSHPETMKAWAVLMRSNVTKALHEGGLSLSDFREVCIGNMENPDHDYLEFYGKLAEACRETEGEMVFYKGDICYCPFFTVSGGATRDAFENFGENTYPYLISVPSHKDEESSVYIAVTYYQKEEFYEKLKRLYPKCFVKEGETTNEFAEVSIKEQDSAGYVKWLAIGDQWIGGEVFRKDMGLPSSCFSIEMSENQVRITCKGVGHGFGFSWYGANAMAVEGKDYRELIEYYYFDVTISKQE